MTPRITTDANFTAIQTRAGVHIVSNQQPTDPDSIWIRLTGGASGSGSGSGSNESGPAYSWEQVIESSDGEWFAPANGLVGSADTFPAYEASRQLDLAEGTIGRGWFGPGFDEIRFISSGVIDVQEPTKTFVGLCYRDCSGSGSSGSGSDVLVGDTGCQAPATIAVTFNSSYLGLISATVSHATGSFWSGTATSGTPFSEGTESVAIIVNCSASSWQATVRSFDNSGNLVTQYHGTLTVTAPGIGGGTLAQDTGPAAGFGDMQFAMNGSGSGNGSGGGSGSTVIPDPCRELVMKWQNADGSICYERIPDCPANLEECDPQDGGSSYECDESTPIPASLRLTIDGIDYLIPYTSGDLSTTAIYVKTTGLPSDFSQIVAGIGCAEGTGIYLFTASISLVILESCNYALSTTTISGTKILPFTVGAVGCPPSVTVEVI